MSILRQGDVKWSATKLYTVLSSTLLLGYSEMGDVVPVRQIRLTTVKTVNRGPGSAITLTLGDTSQVPLFMTTNEDADAWYNILQGTITTNVMKAGGNATSVLGAALSGNKPQPTLTASSASNNNNNNVLSPTRALNNAQEMLRAALQQDLAKSSSTSLPPAATPAAPSQPQFNMWKPPGNQNMWSDVSPAPMRPAGFTPSPALVGGSGGGGGVPQPFVSEAIAAAELKALQMQLEKAKLDQQAVLESNMKAKDDQMEALRKELETVKQQQMKQVLQQLQRSVVDPPPSNTTTTTTPNAGSTGTTAPLVPAEVPQPQPQPQQQVPPTQQATEQQQQQPSNSTSAPNMSPARANRNRSYSHNQSALNEICGDCNEPYSKFPYCHTTGTRHPHPKHYGEGGVPTRTEDNRQQPQQPPSRGSSQRPPSPPKPNEYNNYNDNNNYQPARQSGDGPPRPPPQRGGGGPTPSTGPIQPRWGTSLRERDETQPEVVIGRKPPLPGRIPQRWGQERYAQGPTSGVPSSPPRGRAPSYPQPVPNSSSGVVRTLDIHETPMRGGGDGDGYYEASNEDPIVAAAAQRSQKGLLTRERVPDPNCPVHSVPRFRDGDNHPMNNNNNMIVSEDQSGPPNWLLQRGYPANGSNPNNPNNNNTNSNTNPNSSANTRNPNSSNARGPTNNNNPTGNSQNPLQMRWAGGAPEAMKSTPLNESAYQEVPTDNQRNNNNDGFNNNPQQQSSNNFMMGSTNTMQPPPTPSSNTVMMVDVPPGTTAAQSAPMMVMPNSSSLWKEWTGPDGIVYVLHEPTGKIKQKTNNGYYEDVILEEGAGHQGPEYNATDPVLNMNTKTIRNVDYYPSYARSMSGAFSSNEVVLPTVPRGQFSPTRTSAAVSLSAPKVAPPVYTGKRLHTITVGMADPNDPSNPNHTMVSLQDSSRVRFDLGEGGNSMFSSGGGGYAHDAPMGPPVSSVLRQRWEYVRNVLTQGRYFVKHSLRTGTTSYRFVYLSSTGNLICWVPTSMVPANAGPRYFGPETRTIPTAAVVQVLPAPLTPVAGFLSQVNPRLDAQCCFGFFCVNDVTLLLESNTREEASYWVDAWNFFLFYSVPGGSNAE